MEDKGNYYEINLFERERKDIILKFWDKIK